MKKGKEPEQFYFVEVHAQQCSAEELKHHLSEFGKAFIDRSHRDRWFHVTQEKPEKASDELGRLLWGVNEKYRRPMDGSSAFPNSLERRFGKKRGVYFDGIDDPCKVSAVEASTLAAERGNDALFSIDPGKLAIFFFHHGDVVLFEKL
ncbi:MAG: hypothetical protein JNJ39_00765 [Blastocatellia bacterium]|nr:hypothetical protein [Blastocatellia bacterium]